MTAPGDALDREVLDALPDEVQEAGVVVPLRYLMALVREARGDGPMVVDSAWLSERYGRSQEWWAERARAGDVRATQDGVGAPWYFDRASCKRHLLSLLDDGPERRVSRRGPWRKAS